MKGAYLWKRILNEGVRWFPLEASGSEDEIDRNRDALITGVLVGPIIVANFEHPELGLILWDDLTNVSVPFPVFFVEGQLSDDPSQRWGSLVISEDREDGGRDVMTIGFRCSPEIPPEDFGHIRFRITPQGKIESPVVYGANELAKLVNLPFDEVVNDVALPAYYACRTMMMLGCKNVSLECRVNEPAQTRRAVKRHGGTPDSYRYHVLVVRPPSARSDAPAQEVGVMPRHVCRGHFAEYGPEFGKGLLFGKYAGRFYIPPHLKGKRENGVVEKDYALPAGAL